MVSSLTDRLQGFSIGGAIKAPVAAASTGNLTLESTQIVDGVVIGASERVLVKDQASSTENGIYLTNGATWTRAVDCDGASDLKPGTLVYVDRGTVAGDTFWVFNSSSTALTVTPDTDAITLSQVTVSISGISAYSQGAMTNTSAAGWRSTLGFASTSLDNGLIRADGAVGLYQDSTWVLGDNSTLTAGGPFLSSDITMPDGSTLSMGSSAAIAMQDGLITRPTLIDYGERVNVLGASSATAIDFDLSSGNVVSLTLISTTARNFTLSNPPASTNAGSITLIISSSGTQDTLSWPAGVTWTAGTAPSLTSSGTDIISLITLNAGTVWYGFTAGTDMK
jgi:hypothetical protein